MVKETKAQRGIEYNGAWLEDVVVQPKKQVKNMVSINVDNLSDEAIDEVFDRDRDGVSGNPFVYLICGDTTKRWNIGYVNNVINQQQFYEEVVSWIAECTVNNEYADLIMQAAL